MKICNKLFFILIITSTTNAQWIFNYFSLAPVSFANINEYLFMGSRYNESLTNKPVFRSSNNGNNWEESSEGIPSPSSCMVLYVYNGILLAGISQNDVVLFRSVNLGETWERSDYGIINSYAVYDITSYNDTLYAKTSNEIYYSIDSGLNWEFLAQVDGLKIAVNKNAIYVGGTGNGLFWSTDRCKTWKHETAFFGLGNSSRVSSLFSTSDGVLIGCNNTNIGITGGYSSKTIKMNLDGTYKQVRNSEALGYLSYADYILMFDLVRVFRTSDLGETWSAFNYGLPGYTSENGSPEYSNPHNLESIGYCNGYLFVGGSYHMETYHGYGIWKRPISELTDIKEEPNDKLVSSYYLSQNYPNPFNPKTKIVYQLHKSDYIKIVLCNILGNEIITLDEGYKSTGYYEIEFNGGEYSSGVYIYSLITTEGILSRKMLLLK